jgi:hypothetical protein
MTGERPVFGVDDHGRGRHARGVVSADGGSVVTVVVTGFGGQVIGELDRGRVGLEVHARPTARPSLASVTATRAGEVVAFEVTGRDDDLDVDRLGLRFLDAEGLPIRVTARGHRQALDAHGALIPVQTEPAFSTRAEWLAQTGESESIARAVQAEVALLDLAGNTTEAVTVPVSAGELVGPGARCDASHVCAPELACGTEQRCETLPERVYACSTAHPLELPPEGEVRNTASFPAAEALFEIGCAERRARGGESVHVIDVPRGRWDLLLAAAPAAERSAPDDMVLAVRRSCLDARASSAPLDACNDDAAPGEVRPRLEVHDVAGGERLYVLVSAVRDTPAFQVDGLAYDLTARLRAVRARGERCDPESARDRCAEGTCDAASGRCVSADVRAQPSR